MFKRILSIISMALILFIFLAFVNVSAIYFAIDMFYFNTALFVLTCILGGITLLFSDLFISYLCVIAIIDSIKETLQYKKDMKTVKNLSADDDEKYDPHADYH